MFFLDFEIQSMDPLTYVPKCKIVILQTSVQLPPDAVGACNVFSIQVCQVLKVVSGQKHLSLDSIEQFDTYFILERVHP